MAPRLDVVDASLWVPPAHPHHVCGHIGVMGHGLEGTDKTRTTSTADTDLVVSFGRVRMGYPCHESVVRDAGSRQPGVP